VCGNTGTNVEAVEMDCENCVNCTGADAKVWWSSVIVYSAYLKNALLKLLGDSRAGIQEAHAD
jgi:hypothetical protein